MYFLINVLAALTLILAVCDCSKLIASSKCEVNEVLTPCGSDDTCEPSCDRPFYHRQLCRQNCELECKCAHGFIRDNLDRCVRRKNCLEVISMANMTDTDMMAPDMAGAGADAGTDVMPMMSDDRIVGGFPIEITRAPYQIAMLFKNGALQCGGSIISSTFILSAAHCVVGHTASEFNIRAGSRDRTSGGQLVPVSNIYQNPNYNSATEDYDFALLKVSRAITLDGSTKQAIRLPAANNAITNGTQTLITGWGDTRNPNENNRFLRGVNIPTITNTECQRQYANTGVRITARMVCAKARGKDSCQGDSGGPMKRTRDNMLIGVVSFGIDCADPRYPGVYARVASVRPWIQQVSGV